MSHDASHQLSSSTSLRDDSRDHASPSSSSAGRRKKHVTTACDSCRKAKAKCDGRQPCGRCAEKLYTCAFAPDEDNRNRAPLKRKLDKLQSDVDFLHDLMCFIRDGDDATLSRVVSLIRRNAPIRDVHQLLKELTGGNGSGRRQYGPSTDELHSTPSDVVSDSTSSLAAATSSRERESIAPLPRRVFGVERLTDIPLHRVPAAPWTSITDDDDLVSHLVSLYATWEHIFFDGIVLELFLRDMRSAQLDSIFCSQFLVNCVLASACPYSDFDEVRTQMGHTSQLMDLFVDQADAALAHEVSTSTLTAVQGLTILSMATKKQDDEEKSREYSQQALFLCSDLVRTRENILRTTDQAGQKELACVLDATLRGALRTTMVDSLVSRQPFTISTLAGEVLAQPVEMWQSLPVRWTPYPIRGRLVDSHYTETRSDHNRLSAIEQELSSLMISPPGEHESADLSLDATIDAIAQVETQLAAWTEQLTDDFETSDQMIPICVIFVRWWEAYMEIITFETQLQIYSIMQDTSPPSDARSVPDSISAISKKRLRSTLSLVGLIRCYRDVAVDVSRIHPILSAVFRVSLMILLHEASSEKDPTLEHEYETQIVEICKVLQDMAHRNPYTQNLIQRMRSEMKIPSHRLHSAVMKILQDP